MTRSISVLAAVLCWGFAVAVAGPPLLDAMLAPGQRRGGASKQMAG